MPQALYKLRAQPLPTLARGVCLALSLVGASSWAAYNDSIQFSSADLGNTYVLDPGFTNPTLPVARMGVGLSAHGRTDVFRGDTEPPTNVGAGLARSTASYTLCDGCTMTVRADFYNRTMGNLPLVNESYLYFSPVGATSWNINNVASQGVVVGSTTLVDGGSATQPRSNYTPAGAIPQPYDRWSTLEATFRRVDVGGVSQLVLISLQRDGVAVPGLSNFNASARSGYDANWLATGFNVGVAADDMAHGLQVLQPELTVTKTSPSTGFVIGGPVRFDITVRNTGSAPATNVVVTDALPAGLTGVSWTCTAAGAAACPAASGTGDLNETLATLAPGASLTYQINATGPTAAGTLTNEVQVAADNGACAGNTAPPCTDSVILTGTAATPVPTAGAWVLSLLTLMLLGTAAWVRRR